MRNPWTYRDDDDFADVYLRRLLMAYGGIVLLLVAAMLMWVLVG